MDISGIRYVKDNRPIFTTGKREEAKKMLLDFFAKNEGKVKGFTGYLVLDSLSDDREEVVLTFWSSKGDMDSFYSSKTFASFVGKGKQLFDSPPERKDMSVVDFKIG